MLKINNVNVYGLKESILASGYPMRVDLPQDIENNDLISVTNLVNNDHFIRAKKLGSTESNSGHGNYLSGIIVQFDITYPEYWSPEFQRYHFCQIISSQSKMHQLQNMDIDKCCNEYISKEIKEIIKKYQQVYKINPTYENYMLLLSNCPLGLEKTMRVSTNYLQLKNIYQQRKNHKLKEDWGKFCDWIETLPFFKDLCLNKIKKEI